MSIIIIITLWTKSVLMCIISWIISFVFVWTVWQYWLCRRSTTWLLSGSEETQETEKGQQTRGFWHASICRLWSGEWTLGQLFNICFFPRPKKNCEADGSDLLNSIGAFWRPWKLKKADTVRKCRACLPTLFCRSFQIFIKPTWPWTAQVLLHSHFALILS